ncbi:phosphoesterase [Weissella minor]|uniref:phosphoesterase n=1 Tax=Weissella minor TaxID=1620 RepID=UPI001BAF618F|nr:phosphoesterase [Weissella minor]MBS0949392.1 phosphoesterase [Weissella minor]
MAIKYFEYYRGNLENGFETIYGKKVQDHAFILTRKNDATLPNIDIADESVDFSRKRQQIITKDFKLRRFENAWQDVSFQWENIDRHLNELITEWQPEYREIKAGLTDEWGLFVQYDDVDKLQRYVGANAYPDNFDLFVNWLTGFSRGKIR